MNAVEAGAAARPEDGEQGGGSLRTITSGPLATTAAETSGPLRAMPAVLLMLLLLMSARAQTSGAGVLSRAAVVARLADTLGERVDTLAETSSHRMDVVFLIDASASVGEKNFRGELGFVRKLIRSFTLEPSKTRVAIVSFASRGQIVRHIDHISQPTDFDAKCQLMSKQLNNITYSGGGTYTYGALVEAHAILKMGRKDAEKVVFLVTDGFSNGGDPRSPARLLKNFGAAIFTFGIQTGNIDELRDIASEPSYAYNYLLNSFTELETLARKAVYRDFRPRPYAPADSQDCESICAKDEMNSRCCDPIASCSCGTGNGHYTCMCPVGYTGTGRTGSCKPCPSGTYGFHRDFKNSSTICLSCPDRNHVTHKIPAVSSNDCVCAHGFIGDNTRCNAVYCPKLAVPVNGYLVKEDACHNVMNAACGIRCQIGYHLAGTSIRLCGENGSWTGEETRCQEKTCTPLRAPTNGRITCRRENEKIDLTSGEESVQPMDTRCQFKCNDGFRVRGSKVRTCLPLSKWDGLKTSCKPIFCEPLRAAVNAEYHPKNCIGSKKLPYSTNCTITCKKGYKLEGPRIRMCVGRLGTWSKRHSLNRCIDKTRPVLHCPSDITVTTLPGRNYAYVNWSLPNVTDNSGAECHVWSKPHITFPWKVHIGKHTVKYVAQDLSGNKARCVFHVLVIDEEPPNVENCENSQVLYNSSEKLLGKIAWEEPVFHDNSGLNVQVNKTFRPSSVPFTVGRHFLSYKAVDKFENEANCFINLTIKDECEEVPNISHGNLQCDNIGGRRKHCNLTCDDGFTSPFETNFSNTPESQAVQVLMCNSSSYSWNIPDFPNCSPVGTHRIVSQESMAILKGYVIDCDVSSVLENLTRYINESYHSNTMSYCNDQVRCTVKTEIKCRKHTLRQLRSIYSTAETTSPTYHIIDEQKVLGSDWNQTGKPQLYRPMDQLEIKFALLARIIKENENDSTLRVNQLKEKIQSMTKSGELNLLDERTTKEIDRLSLNLQIIFKDPLEVCEEGTVLKRHGCVKCPLGTFHNVTRGKCQSCPIGEYQDAWGSISCKKCPNNYSTKKLHTKSAAECIAVCRPGHYSRKKHHPNLTVTLTPCISCEIGFYQPQYGQSQCLACPADTITEGRASISASDCLPANASLADFCRSSPCLNRAACIKEKDSFSCNCTEHFVGSRCEIFINPCLSSPCSSAGQCTLRNDSNGQPSYNCLCKPGYAGNYCETLIDECSYSPCRNGGTCSSTDNDISCTCRDGFEGDFCEVAANHCLSSPCEMSSTCHNVNGTWTCLCRPGYLGLRCNLLPCDWLPCHSDEICINEVRQNASKSDYRCECAPGITGKNCSSKVDHCKNHECQNNGMCQSNSSNYSCQCPIPFTGSKCEITLSSDYIMRFPKSGVTDFVTTPGPSTNLSELTVCFWLQSVDIFNYGTVVSYATPNQDNAFTLTDYNGFILYVNGERAATNAQMTDGLWHFICVTWESQSGSWHFYVDGILKNNGTSLSVNKDIQGNGTFVFGQEQDEVGGCFSETESFIGKLSLLDIWDEAKAFLDIKELAKTCRAYYGTVVAWAQLQNSTRGDIEILDGTFCQGCPPPVTPYKGSVNVSNDGSGAIYSCEPGYEFYSDQDHLTTLKRECLKHGHWDGSEVPSCVRISCPFPGHFVRGRIEGGSYMFGDKVFYHCNDGYSLRGNTERICRANGKWSGKIPFCIGITCKNLLAPDDGDIEYITTENDRDDLTILQVGQKLEFKCNAGYILIGQKVLTCLKNGSWDFERPTCRAVGCSSPRQSDRHLVSFAPSNETGVKSMASANAENSTRSQVDEDTYGAGDIVAYSCRPGFKFEDNHNLIEKFKLQCTANGTWIGFVPDCIPRQCPRPSLQNTQIIVLETGHNETSDTYYFTTEKVGEANTAENVKIQGTFQFFSPGSRLKIICEGDHETVSKSAIWICDDDETWRGDHLSCELSRCSVDDHPIIRELIHSNNVGSSENTHDSVNNHGDDEPNHHGIKNLTNYLTRRLEMFDVHYEGDSSGNKTVLKCRSLYRGSADQNREESNDTQLIWICVRGIWNFVNKDLNENQIMRMILEGDTSVCSNRLCSTPVIFPHGSLIPDSSLNNRTNDEEVVQSLSFKCHLGYNLVGPEKAFCSVNRTWSSIPNCKPVKCKNHLKVHHYGMENKILPSDSSTYGTKVSYECLPGYRAIGRLEKLCLANGRWSRVRGRCARISCGRPRILDGAIVNGTSYLYQDHLTHICPGEKLQGTIVCNRDGRWSASPLCQ